MAAPMSSLPPPCHMARRISVLQMLEIRPPRYIFRERHVTVIWMKKVTVGQTRNFFRRNEPRVVSYLRFLFLYSKNRKRKRRNWMSINFKSVLSLFAFLFSYYPLIVSLNDTRKKSKEYQRKKFNTTSENVNLFHFSINESHSRKFKR